MKNKYIVAVLLCLTLASCGEDRRKEYAEDTALDRWIESVMRENYYWHQEMPTGKLNYFEEPATFFKKLLSKKDAGYSYIEDLTDIESLRSYGIQFEVTSPYNDTAYAARVLYVDSDSPANEAGLERGDWIIKRNDQYIIRNRIDSLYKGGPITLTLGEYEVVNDENDVPTVNFKDKAVISLSAARVTSDDPVHFYGVYRTQGGKRVGYLAYNRFISGEGENDVTYDNQLRSLSNSLKPNNLDEFILDLRYNSGGGSLESAQLLGSILAPQEALGNAMCHLRYSDLQSSRDETLNFSNEILGSGSNLNMKRLYVITTSATASTSDVLINALKPYMDEIILVGQTTKGNHTGTHAYSNEEEPLYSYYILHPVDCMIYNSAEEMPTGGFSPTSGNVLNESEFVEMNLIGSNKEIMLYSTLYLIDNGSLPTFDGTRSAKTKVPRFSTLDNIQIRGTSIRR